MTRYQIDITFYEGNSWISFPLEAKEVKKHVNLWLKNHKDNIKTLFIHNYDANKKVYYNKVYNDYEILNKNNTIPKDYRTYKTLEAALKHCI